MNATQPIEPTWISTIPKVCPKPSALIATTMTLTYNTLNKRFNLDMIAQNLPLDGTVLGTHIYNRYRGIKPVRSRSKKSSNSYFQHQCTIYVRLKDPKNTKDRVIGFLQYDDEGNQVNDVDTLHRKLPFSSGSASDIIGWKFVGIKLFTNGKLGLIACTKIEHAKQAIQHVLDRLNHLTGLWEINLPERLHTIFVNSKTLANPYPVQAAKTRAINNIEKHRKILQKLAKVMDFELPELDLLEEAIEESRNNKTRRRPMTLEQRVAFVTKQFSKQSAEQEFIYVLVFMLRQALRVYHFDIDLFFAQNEDGKTREFDVIDLFRNRKSDRLIVVKDVPAYLPITDTLMMNESDIVLNMVNCTFNNGYMFDQTRAYKLLAQVPGFTVRSKQKPAIDCTFENGHQKTNVFICHQGSVKISAKNTNWMDCLKTYQTLVGSLQKYYRDLLSPSLYLNRYREISATMPNMYEHDKSVYIKKRVLCSHRRNVEIYSQCNLIKTYSDRLDVDDYQTYRGKQTDLDDGDHGELVITHDTCS